MVLPSKSATLPAWPAPFLPLTYSPTTNLQVVLPSKSATLPAWPAPLLRHSCLAAAVHLTDDEGEVTLALTLTLTLTLNLTREPYG